MESEGGAKGAPSVASPDVAEALKRHPWGKIAIVVLVVLLLIAALAVLARRPNRPPVVSQTSASPASPQAGTLLTFTAQAVDPDGDELSYSWDFGDGSRGTGAQPSHMYSLPGEFIALLTVSDGKGGEATNDANLLRVEVAPKASDIAAKPPCGSATCTPGPVVAVLNADRYTAEPGTPVGFDGNSSWAYAFTWNNSANHSEGGTYSVVVASENATLFALFRYVWGDGTANTTGTSELVGRTTHAFNGAGNYFVWLTVTYLNANLNPSTKSAFAGYTVRVLAATVSSGARAEGSPWDGSIIAGPRAVAAVARAFHPTASSSSPTS